MATVTVPRISWRGDRLFFTGMTAAFVVVTFIGFAPTYYLSSLTSAPSVGLLVHIHGVIGSAWVLLLLAQTALISLGQETFTGRPA